MFELLLLAQAALNLYVWEPADGPVYGYHVYVNGELEQTTYQNEAWIDLAPGDVIEVQAVDADYRTGPVSEPSEPHETSWSCVVRDTPACLADVDGGGVVGTEDVLKIGSKLGSVCDCPGDLNGDLLIGGSDYATSIGLIGAVCE